MRHAIVLTCVPVSPEMTGSRYLVRSSVMTHITKHVHVRACLALDVLDVRVSNNSNTVVVVVVDVVYIVVVVCD